MLCCVLAAVALLPILGPACSRLAAWLLQAQGEALKPCCEGEDRSALMKSGHATTAGMFSGRHTAFIATLAAVIVISVLSAITTTGGTAEAEPDLWLEALGSWCRPMH